MRSLSDGVTVAIIDCKAWHPELKATHQITMRIKFSVNGDRKPKFWIDTQYPVYTNT